MEYEALRFHEQDLQFQQDTILSFLSEVHPFLTFEKNEMCVEIRPILREGKDFKRSRSLLLWNFNEESIARLGEFLVLHNGVPACLYYSVYAFDHRKKVVTKRGRITTAGRINTENAIFTQEIALDFDGISGEEKDIFDAKLNAVGLYPIWVFTGHGFQAHFLLDEPCYEKDALLKFVYKFRSKGFPADLSCIDPARLMRVPFTYNCKGFLQEEHPERQRPKFCDVIKYSYQRYSILELEELLDGLPVVNPEEEQTYLSILEQKKSILSAPTKERDDIEVKRLIYPFLSHYNIPEPVCKMLACTPEGFRNKSLGFLIRFFKTYLRMSKEQIQEILTLWSQKACVPAYEMNVFREDFRRLFYTYSGLNYDRELAKQFGYIPFENQIELRKKEFIIPQSFFEDLHQMDGKVVRMYLAIRLLEYLEKAPTQAELSKILKISERNIRPTLQALLRTRHCYVVEGNRKGKIPNSYHSSKIYPASSGYIPFSFNDIKCYITELFEGSKRGNGELKLYLFMRYRFYLGEIFMSQKKLGQAIGFEQNSVSDLVKRLEEKYFLKVEKRKIPLQPHLECCYYTLLR